MQCLSERAQTTEQNYKAKKGLISSFLLPLVMLWKMETLPTQQCQEGSSTDMGTPQWNGKVFRVSEAESPLTTTPQTSPTYCHTSDITLDSERCQEVLLMDKTHQNDQNN